MHDPRDKNNTLLVVEHEEAIIRAADHLLDIGPGRGEAAASWFMPVARRFSGGARVPRPED
jgi:hypothetical protein